MGLRKKTFHYKKGHFNDTKFTKIFCWKKRNGEYVGWVRLDGSYGRMDDINVYIRHNSSKDYVVVDIILTGDNSKDGKFSTLFAKSTKEYTFTSVVKTHESWGTETYDVLNQDERVTYYMVRGEKLSNALFWASRGKSYR